MKISDFCYVSDYVANGSFKSLRNNVNYLDDGYAVLVRLTDFTKKWQSDFRYVSENAYKFLKHSKLYAGDLIMANVGDPGIVFIVPDLKKPMTLGPNSILIRPTSSVAHTKFIYWYFKSKLGRDQITSITSATAQKKFNKTSFRALDIKLPPLAEQQRIAALLDKTDHILKLRESVITKLDQLASTTFDEMYDALDTDSTKSLGEIIELQRGASPRPISDWMTEEEDGINWIKIADATASDKYIYKCKERIKKEAVTMTRYVKSGDFLLSNSMSFGRPYILKTDGCIHDGWLLLRDTKNIFEQDFLYAALSCKNIKEQFKKLATGAVVKNLNIDAVSKVKIKIPEKRIQKLFSEKMLELEANKALQVRQLSIFKSLLSSLQYQSFSVN